MNKGGYERKRIDDYCELGKNGEAMKSSRVRHKKNTAKRCFFVAGSDSKQRDAALTGAKKSMMKKKRKYPRQGLRETYKKGHGSVTLHPLAQRKV